MKTLDGLTVYEAEKEIRDYLSTLYVSKPKMPTLKNSTPKKEEIKEYSGLIAEYENQLIEYKELKKNYDDESTRLYDMLEKMVRDDSGLNDIPEQYRKKVYSYAWQQGHSSGYSEVYSYLCDLVDIFN